MAMKYLNVHVDAALQCRVNEIEHMWQYFFILQGFGENIHIFNLFKHYSDTGSVSKVLVHPQNEIHPLELRTLFLCVAQQDGRRCRWQAAAADAGQYVRGRPHATAGQLQTAAAHSAKRGAQSQREGEAWNETKNVLLEIQKVGLHQEEFTVDFNTFWRAEVRTLRGFLSLFWRNNLICMWGKCWLIIFFWKHWSVFGHFS